MSPRRAGGFTGEVSISARSRENAGPGAGVRAIQVDNMAERRRIDGELARIGSMLETLDTIVVKLGAPATP
jgi:hypothetical protein